MRERNLQINRRKKCRWARSEILKRKTLNCQTMAVIMTHWLWLLLCICAWITRRKKNHWMNGRGGKSRKRRRRRKELLYIKKIRSDRPAGREKCKNRKLRLKIKIYNNKAWRKLFSHFHSTPLNYDSHISHN